MEPLEQLLRAVARRRRRDPCLERPERKLLRDRPGEELVLRVLEHAADGPHEAPRVPSPQRLPPVARRERLAGDHGATGWPQQATQELGERRLAGSVRAGDRQRLGGAELDRGRRQGGPLGARERERRPVGEHERVAGRGPRAGRGGGTGRSGTQIPAASSSSPWRAKTCHGAPSASTPPPASSTTTRSTRSTTASTRCSTRSSVAPIRSSTRRRTSPDQRRPAGIQVRGRLVEQQQRRAAGRGCRPARAAAAPRRRGRAVGVPAVREADRGRASSTRGQISPAGTPRFSRPNATSSPARPMTSCGLGVLEDQPGRGRARARAGRPSTRSAPSASPPPDGSRRPASAARSVDLPAPEAPSRRTRSPSPISRSRPRSAHAARPACRQPQPWASILIGPSKQTDGGQMRRWSRPASNPASTPVRTSARSSSHDPRPAIATPLNAAAAP